MHVSGLRTGERLQHALSTLAAPKEPGTPKCKPRSVNQKRRRGGSFGAYYYFRFRGYGMNHESKGTRTKGLSRVQGVQFRLVAYSCNAGTSADKKLQQPYSPPEPVNSKHARNPVRPWGL